MNERDKKYILVSSNSYLIDSSGKLILSGIEFIDGNINENKCVTIETGKESLMVKIHLIDGNKEPNSLDENNRPTTDALPDFIVEFNSFDNSILNEEFLNSMKTF